MKEIKAYLRPSRAEHVAHALATVGLSDLTIINVKACGAECDPESLRVYEGYTRMYWKVVKMEIVCTDEEVARLTEIIQKTGHTGLKGDGMICVADVEEVVSIRTGTKGEDALLNLEQRTH